MSSEYLDYVFIRHITDAMVETFDSPPPRARPGEYLLTTSTRAQFAVSAEKFHRDYRVVGDGRCTPLTSL